MCVALALEPTEPTVLKAHLTHSQDQRMSRVFIDSQGPHSVKSPVSTQAGPRKSKSQHCSTWQPPSRRTEQPRYVYLIRFRHLMVHSEFSPLVCPTSHVESKLGRLSCAGGKYTSVFYHHVLEESEPVASPPTLTLRKLTSTLSNAHTQGPRPVYVVVVRDTWLAVQTYGTGVPGGRKPWVPLPHIAPTVINRCPVIFITELHIHGRRLGPFPLP